MNYAITVTSKNQITIPTKIAKSLNIVPGDKLIAQSDGTLIKLQKAQSLLDSIAGSVEVPKAYRSKKVDFIIRDAKREFFKNKK